MRDVEGRTAFVTGGDSGIGYGIAAALRAAGADVVICGLTQASVSAAVERLRSTGDAGGRAEGVVLDVRDRARFEAVADDLELRHGGVDILVNNAGVGFLAPALETSFEQWDWVLQTNLTGVYNGIRTFAPRMLARGRTGHIVTTASIAGMLAGPGASYVAAKFGVVGLMEALASELRGTPVRVSVLIPGIVRTNIINGPPPPGSPTAHLPGGGALPDLYAAPMEPEEVGERVVEAIRQEQLYLFTHTEHRELVSRRFDAVLQSMPREEADPVRAAVERAVLANPLYDEVLEALG